MRLIDADPLLKKTADLEAVALEQVAKSEEWHMWDAILTERTAFKYDLMDAPTVDAVEVVRCKDCFYCRKYNEIWQLPKRDVLLCIRLYGGDGEEVSAEDYCSFAERREDETN